MVMALFKARVFDNVHHSLVGSTFVSLRLELYLRLRIIATLSCNLLHIQALFECV